ncbi:MAG: RlmI/RlmK family 23S rRNA methyltransferase [Cellvibrionales bacterium]|jgi:23S rRNA (cytosine1962-C5)-methyltransferase|nr:RlmI/RlmK family 23S rRNA methyltransferase [Cellvibrionales bacterium]
MAQLPESTKSTDENQAPEAALPVVVLKTKSDRRIKQGHCWVYSNEIDIERSQFKFFAAGQQATLVNPHGLVLGSGYFNPQALLCGRLYSRADQQPLDAAFIRRQVTTAYAWRQACYQQPYYRLVYGDGDNLPGLVIDRYGDVLVMQINTAGMMAVLEAIVSSLVDVLKPSGILLRNEKENTIEQLPAQTEVLYGEVPDFIDIIENGVAFHVPVMGGQKTGWFYDHRDSRALLAKYCQGKRVLDVYSYLGGWGLQAMASGAESVTCIDSSASALAQAEASATTAGCDTQMRFLKGAATDVLKSLIRKHLIFDVIVLDPPAFIKRRKDQRSGENAYHHINQLAIKLLAESGLLVSASCSLHLPRESLTKIVQSSAARVGRQAMIVHQGGLGADHPVNVAMPEMDYLKAVFARID